MEKHKFKELLKDRNFKEIQKVLIEEKSKEKQPLSKMAIKFYEELAGYRVKFKGLENEIEEYNYVTEFLNQEETNTLLLAQAEIKEDI